MMRMHNRSRSALLKVIAVVFGTINFELRIRATGHCSGNMFINTQKYN